MAEIQSLFSEFVILEPHRFFVHEGDVVMISKDTPSTRKNVKLVLFNDKILYATRQTENKNSYTDSKFLLFPQELQWEQLPNGGNNVFLMCIKFPKNHVAEWLVETKSEEEKSKWIKLFESTEESQKRLKKH